MFRFRLVRGTGLRRVGRRAAHLFARIDAHKLLVRVAHLKSSGGPPVHEKKNAQKREVVASAIAAAVAKDGANYPGYTGVVAGDTNTGETDPKRGKKLTNDSSDGYDDTHGIFADGLVSGVKMKSLTIGIEKTYKSDNFPGSGPIDSIYVNGPAAAKFATATRVSQTYGSDHWGVVAVYTP